MLVMHERGHGRVYEIKPSQFTPKVRTPYLGDAYFELPSDQLTKEYETKRATFIKSRYHKALNEITTKESSQMSLKDILEEAKTRIDELRNTKGNLDVANIQIVLGIGKHRSYMIKRKLLELEL